MIFEEGVRRAAHDPPIGIDRDRHLRLKGRSGHMWERRGTLLIFAVVPILALFNVFGQASLTSNANSPTASLSVDSPAHVRSGLMFTAQITVHTAQDVSDLQLTLDRGWFESITFDGIVPQPSNESAENGTNRLRLRRRAGEHPISSLAFVTG